MFDGIVSEDPENVLASIRILPTTTRGFSFRLSESHLVLSREFPESDSIFFGKVISDRFVQPANIALDSFFSSSGSLMLLRLVQFSNVL